MGTTAVDTTGELEGLKSWLGEVCEAFVDRHYTQVFRFFQWLTADREAAADLTQETFAAFWESIARKDPAASSTLSGPPGGCGTRWGLTERQRSFRRPAHATGESRARTNAEERLTREPIRGG